MSTAAEIRNQLEEAATFARAGDITSAVAHARAAVRNSSDDVSRAEASLALERLEAHERTWRAEVADRETEFVRHEQEKP
jgi:hypothetical protein